MLWILFKYAKSLNNNFYIVNFVSSEIEPSMAFIRNLDLDFLKWKMGIKAYLYNSCSHLGFAIYLNGFHAVLKFYEHHDGFSFVVTVPFQK